MADLSDLLNDPTLEAMKRNAATQKAREPRRHYLGASSVGHICERHIWLDLQGQAGVSMSWKGAWATEDGHRTEDLIIERLQSVPGVTVTDRQSGFSDMDGKFKGHIDGIIIGILQSPGTPHLLEIKCCNETKFNKLVKLVKENGEKAALEAWDVQFYAQAQVYMLKFGLTRHYLVCATPGGRDVTSCRTEFNQERAKTYLSKAQRIINARQAPERIGTNKDFYICRLCSHHQDCWK